MARFRNIVKNRNFSLLWVGQTISQFGDRLNQMALIALVYRYAPGSSMQMAKIMAFTIIPVFLIGPIAGVYVDRWDRRRTMVVCDILRGLLVLLIPVWLMRLPRASLPASLASLAVALAFGSVALVQGLKLYGRERGPAEVRPAIGAFIALLLPWQAALILTASTPGAWAAAVLLLALWPLSRLAGRRFSAS